MAASAKALQDIAENLSSLNTKVDSLENAKEVRIANEKREGEARLAQKDRDNKLYMILLALVGAIIGAEVVGTPLVIELPLMAVLGASVLVSGRLLFVRPRGWPSLIIITVSMLAWTTVYLISIAQGVGIGAYEFLVPVFSVILAFGFIWHALVLRKEEVK